MYLEARSSGITSFMTTQNNITIITSVLKILNDWDHKAIMDKRMAMSPGMLEEPKSKQMTDLRIKPFQKTNKFEDAEDSSSEDEDEVSDQKEEEEDQQENYIDINTLSKHDINNPTKFVRRDTLMNNNPVSKCIYLHHIPSNILVCKDLTDLTIGEGREFLTVLYIIAKTGRIELIKRELIRLE
eukprot:UN25418